MHRKSCGLSLVLYVLVSMLLMASACIASSKAANSSHEVSISYFYTAGCPGCSEIRARLQKAQREHNGVKLLLCNLADPKNVDKMNAMYDQFHVPYERWNGRLAVFAAKSCFINEKEVNNGIDRVLNDTVSSAPMKSAKSDTLKAGKFIFHNFKALGIGTILLAGLLDGLEPCAIATLIFFVSYITYVGRKQRDIWVTGAAFSVGVFLAYLAMGLGLLRFIQLTQRFEAISRASFGIIGLFAIAMSVMSFYDYRKAKLGNYKDMSRQLPGFMKKRIHETIRFQCKTRAMALAAFVVGMAVAVMEMPCTGEIYIPTITYVVSVPEYHAKALYYLVVYSLMFTIPLLVIFFAVGLGFKSSRLVELSRKYTAATKFVLGCFFALIGTVLIVQTLKIYGLLG